MSKKPVQARGLDGDHISEPITASEAFKRSSASGAKRSNGLNYKLTIRRVYNIIKVAADKGADEVTFKAPSFVLDGCIGDPIVLARQIKARLTELGYRVSRTDDTLQISWGG